MDEPRDIEIKNETLGQSLTPGDFIRDGIEERLKPKGYYDVGRHAWVVPSAAVSIDEIAEAINRGCSIYTMPQPMDDMEIARETLRRIRGKILESRPGAYSELGMQLRAIDITLECLDQRSLDSLFGKLPTEQFASAQAVEHIRAGMTAAFWCCTACEGTGYLTTPDPEGGVYVDDRKPCPKCTPVKEGDGHA